MRPCTLQHCLSLASEGMVGEISFCTARPMRRRQRQASMSSTNRVLLTVGNWRVPLEVG
jgi:hypothetical protein